MGALKAFTDDGLFIGQSKEFFAILRTLAEQADAARRGGVSEKDPVVQKWSRPSKSLVVEQQDF